jgi:hypothetical protein
MATTEQVQERNRVRAFLALRQASDALASAQALVDELAEMVGDYRCVHWSDAKCLEALGAAERARTEIQSAHVSTASFPDETEADGLVAA